MTFCNVPDGGFDKVSLTHLNAVGDNAFGQAHTDFIESRLQRLRHFAGIGTGLLLYPDDDGRRASITRVAAPEPCSKGHIG
jgi:hypothetical protein